MSSDMQNQAEDEIGTAKPRLALMGEFSAGKSTLSNLLLGASPLPVKVTATRLPPIWISYGNDPASREDMDGNIHPIDVNDLESVQLEETKLIRLSLESDLLNLCDLIDMPGISDPNMAAEVWQNVIGEADSIVWCSHATQAWRQSEAAVWDSLPEELWQKSLLLLTRFDKIQSERDRGRVLARVRRETEGLFSDMFPISLTEAMSAGDDRQAWKDSGAEAFAGRLVELLMNPDGPSHGTYGDVLSQAAEEKQADPIAVDVETLDDAQGESATVRVMPSRVRAKPDGQKTRRGSGQENGRLPGGSGLSDMAGNV